MGYRNIFFLIGLRIYTFFCFNGLWREGWVELNLHPSRVKCSLMKWKFPKISKTGFWDCAAWCFLETFEKDVTAGTGTRCQCLREISAFWLSSFKHWVKNNLLISVIAVSYLYEKFLIRREFHLSKILFEYFRKLWGVFLPPDACCAEESSSFLCFYLSFRTS